ncbi:hypothetical protein J0H58_34915 [bacterium]|nr:hypothetical protein [bacterium]
MRLRIWGRLAVAAVGAAALAAPASAQTPVVIPQQVVAQPAPGPTTPTVPPVGATPMALPGTAGGPPAAAAATPVPPAPGATVVTGNGGCTNCGPTAGTSHRGFVMNASGGYFGTNCRSGAPCNNGCGSFRADAGMLFGSCRSFFSPCGASGLFGKHGGTCNNPVLNGGLSGPFNPCVYDSYLNH